MNYKQLQRLNEIIEVLKANPNSDENIQFVLDLADKSVKIETLETLIRKDENKNLISENESIKSDTIQFTKGEVSDMDKTFKKHFIINGYIAHVRKCKSGKNSFYFQKFLCDFLFQHNDILL